MKFLFPVALATFVAFASATDTCDVLEAKIPDCAQSCVNNYAATLCTPGDLECSCAPETLEQIIEGSADCVAAACEGAGPVFPLLRDFCECALEGSTPPTTTSGSSVTPPEISTSSEPTAGPTETSSSVVPTETSTSTSEGLSESSTSSTAVETSELASTTSQPVTSTSTAVTSSAPIETTCATGRLVTTETVTLTATLCPVPPIPSPSTPPYPSQPGGPGAPGISHVPTATPQPPPFTGAGAITHQNSGLLASIVAVFAGFTWL